MALRPIRIKTFGASFRDFTAWLGEARGGDLRLFEHAANGFEQWLRAEFWLFLLRNGIDHREVGMEYRAELDEEARSLIGERQKRVDLWVRANGHEEKYHYAELKVVFPNKNANKMFASAGRDLWSLRHLHENQQAASVSAVVVGPCIDDALWEDGARVVIREAEVEAVSTEFRRGTVGPLRWGVWTCAVAPG